MRTPARRKTAPKAQVCQSVSYPAPIGGWNARDALAAMKPTDAITLENWFPRTSYVEIRGGYANHVTGITGAPKTLAVYNALDGTNKMFAVNATAVYDVTTAGAVGASVATVTNAQCQWLNAGNGTDNYLILCNGTDKPLYYNGTTWVSVDAASSPALTGLTTTKIISAFLSKGRLFFIEKDSLSFWYLAAGAVGGALTEFPLDGVAKKGGYLVAGATWTFDGGDGADDAVVLATSQGEIIVYKGTNPSSGSTWALAGVFDLGRPLGRRCMGKLGGDLILITEGGVFPLAKALESASVDRNSAMTNKIESAFVESAVTYGSTFGWEMTVYPAESAVLFNIPSVGQYVMNTITKAWCKFTDWDAETFAVFNGELYFATSTKVVKAWTGFIDGTSDIVAYGKGAFSYFGNTGSTKRVLLYRPVLAVTGSLSFLTDIDVDFRDFTISGSATYTPAAGAVWDISFWNLSYWASAIEIVRRWTSPAAYIGNCIAPKIKVATSTLQVQWLSNDMTFEVGGPT